MDSDLAGYVSQAFGFGAARGMAMFSLLRSGPVPEAIRLHQTDMTHHWRQPLPAGYHPDPVPRLSDTAAEGFSLGLNYAAAITLPRGAEGPSASPDGHGPTLDGHAPTGAPGDASGQTHVPAAGIRGPHQTEEQRRAKGLHLPDPFGGPPSCQPLPSPDHATLQHRQNRRTRPALLRVGVRRHLRGLGPAGFPGRCPG